MTDKDPIECCDAFADRINEAFEQLENPTQHTTYKSIGEFLAALDKRIN